MASRVIIVSPDASLPTSLGDALPKGGIDAAVTLLTRYPSPEELRSIVSSEVDPIAAFIVDLSGRDSAIRLIQRLNASYSDSLVVGAEQASSSESILAAMRAGAAEFLVPPFDVSHLREIIESKSGLSAGAKMGRLLCVLPAKAGSGASTLSIHLAGAISGLTQEQTLLIDFDFHCGAIPFRLQLKPEFSLVDAVARVQDLDEIWDQVTASWNKTDVLAAPPSGEILSVNDLGNVPQIITSAVRSYPYVLMDLPPAPYASCQHILDLFDTVYVISTPELVSLHLARRRVRELISLGLSEDKIRLILGRAGSALSVSHEDVAQVVGLPIYWTLPNDYRVISEASMKGGLVPGGSRFGLQVAGLAAEITGMRPEPVKKPARQGWQNLFTMGMAKAPSAG